MDLNELLEINQFNALNLEVTPEGEVLIHGELQNTDKTCPACGEEAIKPHQYYEKRVRHLPVMEKPTYLAFERKDWICACGKVFLERLDFQDLKSKYTVRYEERIYARCKYTPTKLVAEEEGVDWDVVARILKKMCLEERRSAHHPRGGKRNLSPCG
jgi:transposase